jgi:hypothetical protein
MASKRSQILERLRTTVLPAISAADGYNLTPKLIERGWRHPGELAGNFPAIMVATTSETRKNATVSSPRTYTGIMKVVLVGYVKNTKANPKADSTGVQLDLDKLIEDITHALYADITQNGLANYTDIVEVETDNGDLTPVAGCAVTVEFSYHEDGVPS